MKIQQRQKRKKNLCFFVRVAKRTQLTATFLMMLMLEKLIREIRDVLLNAQKYVKKCYLNIKCVECGKDHHSAVCRQISNG